MDFIGLKRSTDLSAVFVSGIYFLIAALLVLTRLLFSFGIFGSNVDVIWTIIVQVVIMGCVPALAIFFKRRNEKGEAKPDLVQIPRTLYFTKTSKKIIYLSIAIGCLTFLANIGVATFFNLLLSFTGYTPMPNTRDTYSDSVAINLIIGTLLTAVAPAIFEEITHRGLLVRGYSSLGMVKAVIYSALMFALMHSFIQQTFYAFFIGVLLGILTITSRSIYPAVIVHFCNNFFNVLFSTTATFKDTGKAGLGDYFYSIINLGFSSITGALLLTIIFCGLIYGIYKLTSYFVKQSIQEQLSGGDLGEIVSSLTKKSYKDKGQKFLSQLFFACTIFLLGFTTLSTFIWGLVR